MGASCISLHGKEITDPPEDMGMVFQRDVLLDWLSVERNILLPSKIRGLSADEWAPKAQTLLNVIGLAGFENRFPWELSGVTAPAHDLLRPTGPPPAADGRALRRSRRDDAGRA